MIKRATVLCCLALSFGCRSEPKTEVPPGDCIAVKYGTHVENNEYKMQWTASAPMVGSDRFYYQLAHISVSDATFATFLFMWYSHYSSDSPSVTAYAKGGIELEVERYNTTTSPSRWNPRKTGAVIRMTDELVRHVLEVGALDAQVSFGTTDMLLWLPANYFLGFSEKAGLGWGHCQR